MATSRGQVNLGVVGFGLVPDTRELELSLTRLRKFGKEVERLGTYTEEAVQKQYNKFSRLERVLTTLFARTQATTEKMRQAGVAAPEIDKVTAAYGRLNRTIIQNADAINRSQLGRGVVGMGAILGAGNRAAAAQEASKLALSMRDLERAAILAVGPLSGIGARLAVMAALFESTTAKMALFIAATTGTAVAMGLLASAGVKATMEMQKFEAQLTAATGGLHLAGDAYNYVLTVANKLGANVKDLVEPYAKFATAARLSNVAVEDQKKIFEAAMTAGTAMRLNGERMGLVFLALEQMFSKGTVTMEELRRQLGDLLPGSFGLAAQAMGVTQGELTKMIRNGEVLAKDLLPKLAVLWMQAFGPSALLAAQSLQGETQRLGSSTFELAKAFDSATRFSDLWRAIIVETNQVLMYLTKHMGEVIGVFGALAGAGVGLAVLSFFSRLNLIIPALVRGFQMLTVAVTAFNLATLATGVGALISFLARLAVVAAGAAAGYLLMRQEIDPLTDSTRRATDQTKLWLDMQEKVGQTQDQVAESTRKKTQATLDNLRVEAEATKVTLQAQLNAAKASEAQLRKLAEVKPSLATPYGGAFFGLIQRLAPESKELSAARARLLQLEGLITEQEDILKRLDKLHTTSVGKGGSTVSSQWETWAEKIAKAIRKVSALGEELKVADLGKEAMRQSEGMAKAIELVAEMPKKGQGDIETIRQSLKAAGFEGANLTDQLAKMFDLILSRQEAIKNIKAWPEQLAKMADQVEKMFEKVAARKDVAIFGDPGELSSARQLEVQVITLTHLLEKMKLTQQDINFYVAEFRKRWGEMAEAESTSKQIKKVTQDLERLQNQLGSTSERAMTQYGDRMKTINEAWQLGAIQDYETYVKMMQDITDDLNRKIISGSTVFGKALTDVFRQIENTSAEILARMALRQEVGWRDMFDSIMQEILTFFYRVAVIQPAMKALFGGLYTKQTGDVGTGALEGLIRGFIGATAVKAPTTYNTPADTGYSLGISGFAGGGSFMVGGSGGTDSQLVAFRATPNERVDVLTADQQAQTRMPSIQVNVINQTGVAMDVEQTPVKFDTEGAVVEMVFRRLDRDGAARRRLSGMLTPPQH